MATADDHLAAAGAAAAAGRVDEAVAQMRAALASLPANDARRAPSLHNLGVLLYRGGDVAAADDALLAALALRPTWPEPSLTRGHIAFAQGRYADAATAFEAGAACAPERLDARFNAARAHVAAGHYSLALPHLAAARALAPTNEDVWQEHRSLLLLLRRDEEALADFLRFESVAPVTPRVAVAGLAEARRMGDAAREARYLALALGAAYGPEHLAHVATLLAQVQYMDIAPADLQRLYATYDRLQHTAPNAPEALSAPRRRADTRVRVGYLSADFRSHVMGDLLLNPIAAHDRSRFAVHAYMLAPPENEDAQSARWRDSVEAYANVARLTDRAVAQRIADDGIDVLVDLMAHSAFARPGILAWKPAPVIVTHLGYHGAVGLREVDFKMTDRFADTADSVRNQIEAPLVMTECVLPLRPPRAPGTPAATRAMLGIPADATVFATFVGVNKLSPRCLAVWRRILAEVPEARLAFSPPHERDATALRRRLEGFGIADARVVFVPYRLDDPDANHARYALVDAALDTMPYTGGDTTGAALAAGVPVVTRVGARHAERVTFSILAHRNLRETVAESDDAYVAIAVRLARDALFREAMRAAVRAALRDPAATDPVRYVRALEDALVRALLARRSLPDAFSAE
jgi:protein O-GlcNAc transferase